MGSTSGIMEYAKNSPHREFIIGTENSIAEHLQYICPDKRFYRCPKLICPNMKLTTLVDVLNALKGKAERKSCCRRKQSQRPAGALTK